MDVGNPLGRVLDAWDAFTSRQRSALAVSVAILGATAGYRCVIDGPRAAPGGRVAHASPDRREFRGPALGHTISGDAPPPRAPGSRWQRRALRRCSARPPPRSYFVRSRFMSRWSRLTPLKQLVEGEAPLGAGAPAGAGGARHVVLVTGGCGFIGSVIVRQLAAELGALVRVRVLDAAAPADPVAGVTYVQGDLRDPEQVSAAMAGCAAVLHVASMIPGAGINVEARLAEVNEGGTANVVAAAEACPGLGALIYTSSVSALIPGGDADPSASLGLREDAPWPAAYVDAYARTKANSERLVLGSRVPCRVVLRPGGVFGLGDRFMADELLKNASFLLGDGEHRIPYVWVEDVAHGHVLALRRALESPAAVDRHAFHLTPEEHKTPRYWEFHRVGVPKGEDAPPERVWGHAPSREVPVGFSRALAAVNELLGSAFGWVFHPALTAMGVAYTQRSYTFRTDNARGILGWEATDMIEAIRRVKAAHDFRSGKLRSVSMKPARGAGGGLRRAPSKRARAKGAGGRLGAARG